MIFAVLPVKAPPNAKQRLAALLAAPDREVLARALYEHVIQTLCSARGLDRIAVATSDEATARDARRRGLLVFEESGQLSHSHSAGAGLRRAAALGATTVVLIPIDVPLLTVAEIEELVAPRPGLVIVPSADGTGTNALVQTPPGIIECRFGPGSFQAHLDQARACGVPVEVLRPPGLTFDLDTPADVAELLERAPESKFAALLRPRCPSRS